MTLDNDRFAGPISVEYFYRLKPWLGLGGIFAFGPTIRGFAELGTGEQGVVLVGVRYKF